MKDYKVVSEIPPGWTISQRDNARKAMLTLGVQSNAQPHLKMNIRPKVATIYDNDGVATQAATEWLLNGDLSNVTRADIVAVVAEALTGVNETAVDAKIAIADYDHAGILEFIKENGWDG